MVAEALPEALVHMPSREFLVSSGLPGTAAELGFTALGDGPLQPFTTRGGRPATGGPLSRR
ncbi:hypothetical protein [Streptomyces wuyuanensis]|uniref:hypothetical protein n=1 Tax=Streptomyces wuyuanensis TaxID=1196353 RepID=UPI003723AAFA